MRREEEKTSVVALILFISVTSEECDHRYLWHDNLVLNFTLSLETCTVKCALVAETEHYSNFLASFLQILVKLPAEDCCKLVKKEIPSIDDDLYAYIKSKLIFKELLAPLVLTLSS